ncbi:nardilysin-like [Brassica napus]|uniref:nardilysin-like n=2 Tax=Brassica TaxID=3705 RepID=UPI002078AB90|nr:nardilysin-like [Brassica napus]XP_048600442.1 nardilysin-like [Brassica napus]
MWLSRYQSYQKKKKKSLTDGEYSIKKQLIYHIFTELVKDELSYIMFEGKQASISNSFSVSEDKLVLKFRGCREKFTLFISKFWQNFKSFSPKLESFESFKEEMSIDLSSIDIKEQSEHMMFTMLYEGSYDVKEKLENLKDISFADLQKFVTVFYSQIFIEGLCYGDMLEKEATEISEIFERRFEEPRTPKVRNESASDRVKMNHPVSRKNAYVFKKSETNSMAKVYFQTSNPKYKLNEEEDGARLSLFSAIIKEELYDQLRTKKQLGYDVSCYKDVTSGVYGFYIYIVSSQYDPDHLLNEIDEFVNGIGSLLVSCIRNKFISFSVCLFCVVKLTGKHARRSIQELQKKCRIWIV